MSQDDGEAHHPPRPPTSMGNGALVQVIAFGQRDSETSRRDYRPSGTLARTQQQNALINSADRLNQPRVNACNHNENDHYGGTLAETIRGGGNVPTTHTAVPWESKDLAEPATLIHGSTTIPLQRRWGTSRRARLRPDYRLRLASKTAAIVYPQTPSNKNREILAMITQKPQAVYCGIYVLCLIRNDDKKPEQFLKKSQANDSGSEE